MSDGSTYSVSMRLREIRDSLVELVAIGLLTGPDSPRLAGENPEHVRLLAESETVLPPIIVHRGSMRVVDGMHRVQAALLRGEEHIPAYFVECADDEAFLFSVAVNMAHGLTLSLQDRTAAAARIFTSHPQWSDRAVASIVGISAKRASELRGRATAPDGSQTRVGRDGRSRPLNCAQGRERASEIIKQDPTASLRQIARAAGISPATAADVRARLRHGADPVPSRQRGSESQRDNPIRFNSYSASVRGRKLKSFPELMAIFDRLRKDPSLRFNESGRAVLRLLDVGAAVGRERERIVEAVPAHCLEPMAELVRGYAEAWQSLGNELDGAKRPDAHESA